MKTEIIQHLYKSFDEYVQKTEDGLEFWFARDLQMLLGYDEWRNFLKVVEKAKVACKNTGLILSDHFVDVNKMVSLGSGANRAVDVQREIIQLRKTSIWNHVRKRC